MARNKLIQFLSQKTTGQTIVEVIIAVGIVALVMTALAASLTLSIRNTAQSRHKNLGTKLSQEGLEIFRRERNLLGWDTFSNRLNSQVYCMQTVPDDITGLVAGSCDSTNNITLSANDFYREATVSKTSPTIINVVITTTWTDGKRDHEASVTQEFRDW